jgi:hypothetical protein
MDLFSTDLGIWLSFGISGGVFEPLKPPLRYATSQHVSHVATYCITLKLFLISNFCRVLNVVCFFWDVLRRLEFKWLVPIQLSS